ncbi:hypothetical protein CesoFtcFv8_027310 [Champsocephalus esox]|nr:hypothetical protein CesoFtcFv8_027310 [Champsocephalus esox]
MKGNKHVRRNDIKLELHDLRHCSGQQMGQGPLSPPCEPGCSSGSRAARLQRINETERTLLTPPPALRLQVRSRLSSSTRLVSEAGRSG